MRLDGDFTETQRYMEETGSSMENFGRQSMRSFMGTDSDPRMARIQIRIIHVRSGSIIIESELTASESLLEEAAANIEASVGTAYTESDGEQRSWTLLSFAGTTTSTAQPTEEVDDDEPTLDAVGQSNVTASVPETEVEIDSNIDKVSVAMDENQNSFMEENYDWIVALAVFIGGGVVLNFVCVCLWYRCRDKSCNPCSLCRTRVGSMSESSKPRLFSRDIRNEQKVAIHDDEYETDDDKLPALPEETEPDNEDERLIPVSRSPADDMSNTHETSEIETDVGSDMDVLDRVEYVDTAGSGDARVLLGFRNKESW